ncbi:hypothetical protein WR25_05452 [Diploscapter pachys]|uniref:Uncharacterized protein n=1 Tax=Diploscapter pachys TaxID=2018661 RepID=A0A2A2JT07_9BILA|nr:hypothetical protein WR25_05452 [Diploscapter pachys]
MVYIGIDLGTTYSCVSVIEDGKPVAIVCEDGKPTIPSVVAYCEPEILVGNPALMCNTDVTNILYDSKRLIGWHVLNDLPNAETRQLWTFNVDARNNVAGYVLNKGAAEEKFLTPEEVSAEILKKLKATAEKYLSTKVTGAVVTVPALFNSDQIAATKRAVELAGLELKYLLKEPTSAAIAYNHKKKFENSKLLIFDFGGGTLDISIAEIKDKDLEVKAVGGDTQLGGQDFDGKIMKYSIDEFAKSSSNYDIVNKPKLIKRLRAACKEGKEALSFNLSSYNIHIDINDELDLNVAMTSNKLNELCNELYNKAMHQVDNVLNTAQLKASQIDHVILVGGMARIPFLQQKLTDKFGNDKLKFDINPDEAVAYGAAIVANALEKGIAIPLINNTMNELARNINNLQIGGDNSSTNSHKILFYCPDPPEWRRYASVAYFKDKLYYLGGGDRKTRKDTNRVNMEDGEKDLLFLSQLVWFKQ